MEKAQRNEFGMTEQEFYNEVRGLIEYNFLCDETEARSYLIRNGLNEALWFFFRNDVDHIAAFAFCCPNMDEWGSPSTPIKRPINTPAPYVPSDHNFTAGFRPTGALHFNSAADAARALVAINEEYEKTEGIPFFEQSGSFIFVRGSVHLLAQIENFVPVEIQCTDHHWGTTEAAPENPQMLPREWMGKTVDLNELQEIAQNDKGLGKVIIPSDAVFQFPGNITPGEERAQRALECLVDTITENGDLARVERCGDRVHFAGSLETFNELSDHLILHGFGPLCNAEGGHMAALYMTIDTPDVEADEEYVNYLTTVNIFGYEVEIYPSIDRQNFVAELTIADGPMPSFGPDGEFQIMEYRTGAEGWINITVAGRRGYGTQETVKFYIPALKMEALADPTW